MSELYIGDKPTRYTAGMMRELAQCLNPNGDVEKYLIAALNQAANDEESRTVIGKGEVSDEIVEIAADAWMNKTVETNNQADFKTKLRAAIEAIVAK